MRKYILILCSILVPVLLSANAYTDYIIKGSMILNGNIYSSDFDQIAGYKNCCPQYKSAFGISPALFFGAEKRNVFNIYGYDVSYSLMLGYNDLSAKYSVQQYIGNDLGVDSYEKIMVDHKLGITYSLLSLENSFWFNPSKDLPLGIKLGFNIGVPIAKDFDQRELLISPSDATFPDGTKEFNPSQGQIPDASPIFAALSLGGRYKVYSFSDYDLFANASFNYGLGSIASGIDLSIHQASLGVSIHYNVPKSELPRPMAPPAPPAPEPPAPPIARKPTMDFMIEFDYNKVISGDTLSIAINKYEYSTFASLLPVLIYEKDSEKIIPIKNLSNNSGKLYSANFDSYENLDFPENYPKIISEHIKNNPDVKFKIVAQTTDENIDVLNSRLNTIVGKLKSAGIDSKYFTTEIKLNKADKEKNPALAEESRKVFFDFSNDGGLVEVKVSTDYTYDNFNKVMNITPVFFAEDTASFSGKTLFNGANETSLKQGTNQVVLSSGMFANNTSSPNEFQISAEVKDSEGNAAQSKAEFYLTHTEKQVKRYVNLNRDDNSGEIEEFIIGYTQFDKSEIQLVNSFALDYIRAKAFEGRAIEIIPLTDNIGTKEYNDNLARKRAESAIKLIGKLNNYEINMPEIEVFSNDSPYGRMMNRAVIIRIK